MASATFEASGQYRTAALATVSGTYYRAMRLTPFIGRFIEPSDVALRAGVSNSVAVISFRVWRSWFRGDPAILGKTIRIESHPFTVIGVEPENYHGLVIDGSSDVTIPILAPGSTRSREPTQLWMNLYGRLQPRLTPQEANVALLAAWPHVLAAARPPGYEGAKRTRFFARHVTLESAANGSSYLRARFSPALRILLALVAAVLAIACLNLAGLSLAKASERRHQTAVRAALGARPWDLIAPPLYESLLLACLGTACGLAFAWWTGAALLRLAWTGLVQTPLRLSLDWRVLAFTAAITLVTAVLSASLPAWYAAHVHPLESLARRSRSVRGSSGTLAKALLVTQIALSLVLLTGALLFSRTLSHLHQTDAGYRRDHLLTLLLFPQPGAARNGDLAAYYQSLAAKIKAIPGVESVSFSSDAPATESEYRRPVYLSQASEPAQTIVEDIAPEFFRAMRMTVLEGRAFSWADNTHSNPPAAVISQSLALRLFGHANPLGRTAFLGPKTYPDPYRIIGVVNNASLWNIESVHPLAIYRCLAQETNLGEWSPLLDVRTTVDPQTLKAPVDRAVRAAGRVYSLRTQTVDERLDGFLTVQRLTALLAGFFAATALLIAGLGLFGLISLHVSRRTAELGIRAALGANRRQIFTSVLGEALRLTSAGCLIGLLGCVYAGRFVKSLLFGVSAADPLTLASACAALLLLALLAAWLPARRAASVDPAIALRSE